jgi:hypothetical protein
MKDELVRGNWEKARFGSNSVARGKGLVCIVSWVCNACWVYYVLILRLLWKGSFGCVRYWVGMDGDLS